MCFMHNYIQFVLNEDHVLINTSMLSSVNKDVIIIIILEIKWYNEKDTSLIQYGGA